MYDVLSVLLVNDISVVQPLTREWYLDFHLSDEPQKGRTS